MLFEPSSAGGDANHDGTRGPNSKLNDNAHRMTTTRNISKQSTVPTSKAVHRVAHSCSMCYVLRKAECLLKYTKQANKATVLSLQEGLTQESIQLPHLLSILLICGVCQIQSCKERNMHSDAAQQISQRGSIYCNSTYLQHQNRNMCVSAVC